MCLFLACLLPGGGVGASSPHGAERSTVLPVFAAAFRVDLIHRNSRLPSIPDPIIISLGDTNIDEEDTDTIEKAIACSQPRLDRDEVRFSRLFPPPRPRRDVASASMLSTVLRC
jgi:hypothetical protein